MPRYKVYFRETTWLEVELDAVSREEARQQAWIELRDGGYSTGSSDTELDSVEEIVEEIQNPA